MKNLLLAAGLAFASASAASAANIVATFDNIGFDILEGPDGTLNTTNFLNGSTNFLNGSLSFISSSSLFFDEIVAADLSGLVTTSFDLGGFGFNGEEDGDFGGLTSVILSGFGSNGSGGDLQLSFLGADVNPFANASVGSSFTATPDSGSEFAQDVAGDFFISRFNGSGSVSFQVVDSFDEPAPVPLPASGLLLIGALGAAGALRKRKS